MSVLTIAFFNNKGGVGKTALVYHLAWMYRDLGLQVLAADLDPQANLTTAFLDEERVEVLWEEQREKTVYGQIVPLLRGVGDIQAAAPEPIDDGLSLTVGDLALSQYEDELSQQWPNCMGGQERGFRVLSAFWRIMQMAAVRQGASVVLMDLGPNLGSINRAALISADYVVVPLAPDLFSLQGLRNLGPRLRTWRQQWRERIPKNPAHDLDVPPGRMQPGGYIVLQHSVRLDRPVQAYQRWIARIPSVYREQVLGEENSASPRVEEDEHCLALLKPYRSLMPMAQEARKPMFHLRPADGAIGAHMQAAHAAYNDFRELALAIAKRTGLAVPV